jgi:hypothetical protein
VVGVEAGDDGQAAALQVQVAVDGVVGLQHRRHPAQGGAEAGEECLAAVAEQALGLAVALIGRRTGGRTSYASPVRAGSGACAFW